MAEPAQTATVQPGMGEGVPGVAPPGNANAGQTQPEPVPMGQNALIGKDAPVRHAAKRRRMKTEMQEIMWIC